MGASVAKEGLLVTLGSKIFVVAMLLMAGSTYIISIILYVIAYAISLGKGSINPAIPFFIGGTLNLLISLFASIFVIPNPQNDKF
jgi:hypothetical protein